MIFEQLSEIITKNKNVSGSYLRNLLKERLQKIALSYIYNSKYASLIFKGGSCLRICFDLPRLSEDLDFDYENKFATQEFFKEISNYFLKEQNFPELETQIYPHRLYLKFPVLHQLQVASPSESDKLFLKIELNPAEKCLYKTEKQPYLKDGFSFLINRYSLPDLMSGKINAVLNRSWFKGKKNEITVKGRDYFDLYWYLQNKIIPNYNCIPEKNIWSEVKKRVKTIKSKDLEYDLLNFVKDHKFITDFCQNFQTLIEKEMKNY